jgi:L-alanine-DL-glutamate epimerase-like enolase superfamily enzyme
MRIESISIYQLQIPFRQSFRHAIQSREESDAVIVRVRDRDGCVGYGEGLPRPYVTGEDTASMISRIRSHLARLIFSTDFTPGWETFSHLQSVRDVWSRSNIGDTPVIAWNAAFCAVELALLDWALRRTDGSLSDYLRPARDKVTYSGVISADDPDHAATLAKKFVGFGIHQIKVKVGTPDDVARLAAVREIVGEDVELRGDANCAWSAKEAVEQLAHIQPFKLWAIEQPVPAHDFAGMKQVREETGLPVMADESLVTADQARQLIDLGACDFFNIRLAKCGGISGSLAIMKLAQEAGISIQVGAQVGETGILSAAGRCFAAHVPDLVAAEGSFGSWLLAEDITAEDVVFGHGGAAPVLKGNGLGVTIKEESLLRLAVKKIELPQ